ncbi:MAG: beta-eliminating lyase-related protein [Deltaproteobacteria bacterium]|nr:beta-eliminating lyase-related protein [Deltaproteobacteria bacterium]
MREIFGCASADVRPYSGNVANEAVFSRLLRGDKTVFVNSTPGGGHISHHKAGSVGKFTKSIVDFPRSKDGFTIDVAATRDLVDEHKPSMLIVGKSLILRPEPVADLAEICRARNIFLHYDGAHVLGLIAGGEFQQPLAEGADLMSGSTHKTFFGTQRGVILSNRTDDEWKPFDRGVFPGSTSNHHLDTLAALALVVEEWKAFGRDYARQVIANARALAHALKSEGIDVMGESFGFTESHQVAVSVKDHGGGKNASRRMAENNIICNMNMLPHEPLKNATNPEGLRLGTQEMTRMGMKEDEMKRIAAFIADCVIRGKNVRDAVAEFRSGFTHVHYSFDQAVA